MPNLQDFIFDFEKDVDVPAENIKHPTACMALLDENIGKHRLYVTTRLTTSLSELNGRLQNSDTRMLL